MLGAEPRPAVLLTVLLGNAMKMRVCELWRYPVKSLAGERLEVVDLSTDGILGDRAVQVYDDEGHIVTARTAPRLLGLKATLDPTGEPLVNGHPWTAPEVAELIQAAAGAGTRLARNDQLDRFDVLPLLVATDGIVEALGMDRRRFRPNLYIAGVEGRAERDWAGRQLRAGEAIIGLHSLRGRCVMTTCTTRRRCGRIPRFSAASRRTSMAAWDSTPTS